jgi:hypothetical protein
MIYKILTDLASDNSRNFKIDYLQKHVDNDLLKRVIFLALDPFTQFYIRKIPQYSRGVHTITLENALTALNHLSRRTITGNAAIDHLKSILESVSTEDALVVERIIQKDLKCGVSDSTVNKVWPALIHEFPCMLASQYDVKLVNKIKWPAMAQLKMDGMRFNAIVKDGKCEFRSRNGKEINLLGNLEQEFLSIANGMNLVFDGELVVSDKGVLLDRQTGNGILNKAVKGTIIDLEAHKVHATLWDVIDYDHFIRGQSPIQYHTRFSKLESMSLPKKLHVVENTWVENIEHAKTVFEKYLSEGQEGIILKDSTGIWENKRAKHLIKFKGELECDLKIVDWIEGTGKYVGVMGALVLESSDGIVKTNVGTGFSDADRLGITRDCIGGIAAVKYNARITDKHSSTDSLFLPVFIEFRSDKSVADSSKDIK